MGKRLIQESIINDKADIIAGGLTGDLLASASLITEAKKPTVIMLSSTSAVIDKSPYFLRTSCTLSQSSGIMADWAIGNDIKKVVTLVTDFSPGHEAEAMFKDRYLAAGGQIAEAIRVPLQNPDFAPFLQRARDAAPQADLRLHSLGPSRYLRQAVRGTRLGQGRDQADWAGRPDR